MIHSYVPENMLIGQIKPEIKDKFGKANSSDNYRAVMSSSNLLKIFEYCILPIFETYSNLHDNQFGYRNATSTLMCATIVREVIGHYISNDTPVFSVFLDMQKAFDSLNHYTLIEKLIDIGIPSNIISVLRVLIHNCT